jgi:hypothetical protein
MNSTLICFHNTRCLGAALLSLQKHGSASIEKLVRLLFGDLSFFRVRLIEMLLLYVCCVIQIPCVRKI